MARIRLRPKYSEEELKQVYSNPHDSSTWIDHRLRVPASLTMCKWALAEFGDGPDNTVADLSCGDGSIMLGLLSWVGGYAPRSIVADYNMDPDLEVEFSGYTVLRNGPIEENLHSVDKVTLFVLSETLEHLDDPDSVLASIRSKSKILFLSTPNGEKTDANPEHYWGWELEDIRAMLHDTGWTPRAYQIMAFPNITDGFQLWVAT